ncbi:MAG: hypothetical protein R3Y16_00380 [Rikenellaceae bacterium]
MDISKNLRLKIFYSDGRYDVVTAKREAESPHWLDARFTHPTPKYGSRCELVVSKPKSRTMAEFSSALRELIEKEGFAEAKVTAVSSDAYLNENHHRFIRSLFPSTEVGTISYHPLGSLLGEEFDIHPHYLLSPDDRGFES